MTTPGCPACGTRTALVRWEDVSGFECSACHGHFVRPATLAKFFDEHEHLHGRFQSISFSVRNARPSPRELSCPECAGGGFRVLRTSSVELDVCSGCTAVYFDAHEATQYFRQTRYKPPGGKVVETSVNTVDGLSAIFEIIQLLP